ncbi:uncharacterized protein TRIADDRAFT_62429 [Trichoplax adhaerens]|uniref:Uncharacterized protein n=1 Tax=Trichoplax adhaerens TaxID=10228 RepID=B3SDR9_TRIAD|nr:predicted protein [Trichoplax adhaerens]EDV19121.1 predicted protein [Trichoplax adhaerens]|eukprot:XP_002118382.1 predicted protein [Trichoplax adhaerens]
MADYWLDKFQINCKSDVHCVDQKICMRMDPNCPLYCKEHNGPTKMEEEKTLSPISVLLIYTASVLLLFRFILSVFMHPTSPSTAIIQGEQMICTSQSLSLRDTLKLVTYHYVPEGQHYQVLLFHLIITSIWIIEYFTGALGSFRADNFQVWIEVLWFNLPRFFIWTIIIFVNTLQGIIVAVIAAIRKKTVQHCNDYKKASDDWFATFIHKGFFYKILYWLQLHVFIFAISFKVNDFNIKSNRFYKYFLTIYFTMTFLTISYVLVDFGFIVLGAIIYVTSFQNTSIPYLIIGLPLNIVLIALIQNHLGQRRYLLDLFNKVNATDIPVYIKTNQRQNKVLMKVSRNAVPFTKQLEHFFRQKKTGKDVTNEYFIFNERSSDETISELAEIIHWEDVGSNFEIVENWNGQKWIRSSIYKSAVDASVSIVNDENIDSVRSIIGGVLIPYISIVVAIFITRTSTNETSDKRTICKLIAKDIDYLKATAIVSEV